MTTGEHGVARYLQVGGSAVHAVLHTPDEPRRSSGVLLLAPFGWDDTSSYRARRAWAVSLANEGYHVLRFDLPGTGDSAGSPRDPDLLAAWTDAIAAAAADLRGEAGCARIAAIGLGLGGLLGLAAIDAGVAIDEIVLWAVPARGRSIVRELKAFARLEASRASDATPLPAGAIVVNGYLLSAETTSAVNELDVASMRAAGLERALLLGRDGLPIDDAIRTALESAGAHVTVSDGPGYGAMTATHQESLPPLALMATVSSWLAASDCDDVSAPSARVPSERRTETDVDVEGVAVRERLLVVEHDNVALAGVLSEPVGVAAPLTAVLLNAGAQRRIGPNRMWVEAARRLAARGVPALRVDLASIGDSGGRDRFPIADGELYEGEFGAQVGAVLDQLVDDGLPPRFLLMGLCSGAYWSFQTGQRDERVAGVVLLNPLALVFDPYAPIIRRTRRLRRLAQPSMWWRLIRGDVARANITAVLRALLIRMVTAPSRFVRRAADRRRAEAAGGTDLDHAFDRLQDNHVRAQLVFSPREPLCEELTREGFFENLDRWPNVRFHLLDGPAETHTLQPLVLQRQVHDVIDAAVDELLSGARWDEPAHAHYARSVSDPQTKANERMWSRTDLVPAYANRDLRAVETTILLRYRDELAGAVLELGCGAGRLTGHLLEVARDVEVLDVSSTMLQACLSAYPAAHGSLGDIRDLSGLRDAAYDAIVAGYGLFDVLTDAERKVSLGEVRRALVPGGLLVLSAHNRDAGADTPLVRCRRGVKDVIHVVISAPRWIPNRLRLTRQEREEPGYAIWNDSSHDYGALHYYITRDEQERQLEALGLTLVSCLDLDGHEVPAGAHSTSSELHFLARSDR